MRFYLAQTSHPPLPSFAEIGKFVAHGNNVLHPVAGRGSDLDGSLPPQLKLLPRRFPTRQKAATLNRDTYIPTYLPVRFKTACHNNEYDDNSNNKNNMAIKY